MSGPRAPRRDLRDRAAPRRVLARGGRRARRSPRAGCARQGSRSRATRPATSSAGAAQRRVWAGSHLDSVPTAGRFDGALGVVAAIEAAQRLPDAPLAVVAFRAEESGPMGSRRLAVAARRLPRAAHRAGPGARAPRRAARRRHRDRGSGARRQVVFEGRADHAGTTPMDARADALVEAAALRPARARVGSATAPSRRSGAIEVEPNASNVVPARVYGRRSTPARPSPRQLDALIAEIGFEPTWRLDPVAMSGAPLAALRAAAPARPSSSPAPATTRCSSRPPACRPAMLFVRSLNGGISHHPDELSSDGGHRARRRCAHRRTR